MLESESTVLGLAIAALGGAAVGLEREWSGHAEGPRAHFAGIRTFTLLGLIGGVSGALWTAALQGPAWVLLGGVVALVAAAYVAASRVDVDGTTEVAALVVIGAGVLAGTGAYRLASGVVAATSLLLAEKSRLHALVARIDDIGLRAGLRFAVMATVVLPLLPTGPYGPWGGIRPRELWALVLFFSGLSFLGFLARRAVGAGQGYLVTGLLGGLVSSTTTTLTFARASRANAALAGPLAFGTAASNAMLYPRVLVALAVLNPSLVASVAMLLVPPWLVAIGATVIGVGRGTGEAAETREPDNPLALTYALQMAVSFQFVRMVLHVVQQSWGQAGVVASAALLGLTDVDALTASMARSAPATMPMNSAAIGIAVGVLANTILKLVMAAVFGSAPFVRFAAASLGLMGLASLAALLYASWG